MFVTVCVLIRCVCLFACWDFVDRRAHLSLLDLNCTRNLISIAHLHFIRLAVFAQGSPSCTPAVEDCTSPSCCPFTGFFLLERNKIQNLHAERLTSEWDRKLWNKIMFFEIKKSSIYLPQVIVMTHFWVAKKWHTNRGKEMCAWKIRVCLSIIAIKWNFVFSKLHIDCNSRKTKTKIRNRQDWFRRQMRFKNKNTEFATNFFQLKNPLNIWNRMLFSILRHNPRIGSFYAHLQDLSFVLGQRSTLNVFSLVFLWRNKFLVLKSQYFSKSFHFQCEIYIGNDFWWKTRLTSKSAHTFGNQTGKRSTGKHVQLGRSGFCIWTTFFKPIWNRKLFSYGKRIQNIS